VITIVSGLPRSGTSLMMQMLLAGGVPILADGERKADIENPRGYYEWEPAKLLPKQPELIQAAQGKAVKIISQLLFALPDAYQYRIVFMERPLVEVLASQTEMIRRTGTAAPNVPPTVMTAALQAHLQQVRSWLAIQKNISARFVKFADVINDPQTIASDLQSFLDRPLDIATMAARVDESLYRQRSTMTTS